MSSQNNKLNCRMKMKVIVLMIQLVLNTFFECLKTLNPHLNTPRVNYKWLLFIIEGFT